MQSQGVTEKLKAEDTMRWIGLMNNIRSCVDEIVLNDIVYSQFNTNQKRTAVCLMAVFFFRQVFKKLLSCEYNRKG